MWTHVEHAVDRATELVERSGGDKERRHEVYRVRAGELTGELRRPSLRSRSLTEEAVLSGESGGEDATIILELVGVVRVRCNVRAKSSSVTSCRARERTIEVDRSRQYQRSLMSWETLTSCQTR